MPNNITLQLHKELRAGIINGEMENPRLEFSKYGLEKEVLSKEKLVQLFKENFKLFELNQGKRANDYADKVLGEEHCRLKILAIILMHPNNTNFKSFLDALEDGFHKQPMTDADLPMSRDQAERIFEDVGVTDFLSDQPIFLALEYTDGEPVRILKEDMEKRRFPIIGEPTPIGRGASGRVEKIRIAPGYFHYKTGRNDEVLELAQKVFDKQDIDTSSGVENFLNEFKIAMRLDGGPVDHRHLMKPIGSVRELESPAIKGKEEDYSRCILLYELAKCNLSEALTGKNVECAPPYDTMEAKSNLMYQFENLVHALNHLHENGIIHVDIKPDNVLVVENTDENSEKRLDRWKLADYNLSKAKEYRGYHPETSSTSGKREAGAYQAPEVQGEGSRIGSWSDLWSLGCIFLVILAYLDGGVKGVTTFDDLRHEKGVSYGSTTRRDRFYIIPENGRAKINPGVFETVQILRANAERRDDREGSIVNEALNMLMTDILVLDPMERRRRNIGQNQKNFLDKIQQIAEMYRDPRIAASVSVTGPEDQIDDVDALESPSIPTRSSTGADKANNEPQEPEATPEGNVEEREPSSSENENQSGRDRPDSPQSSDDDPESEQSTDSDIVRRETTDTTSCTELCKAARTPNVETAKSLLKRGKRAHEMCPRCRTTPLHSAIQRNSLRTHESILEAFLKDEAETSVTTQDASGRTALVFASQLNKEKAIELLLDWYKRKGQSVPWSVIMSAEHRSRQNKSVRRMISKNKETWGRGQELPN